MWKQSMPCKWKPDRARGSKRESRQRLERQQSRKEFAKNMARADDYARQWYNDSAIGQPAHPLELKFIDWAIAKYKYLKHCEEMSQPHKDMTATWREISASAEACAKATAARWSAKRNAAKERAVAKFRANRTQSRIEAAERIAAEMQQRHQP